MDVAAVLLITMMVSALLRGWALMVLLAHLHIVGLSDVHSSYLSCVGFAFLLTMVLPGGGAVRTAGTSAE